MLFSVSFKEKDDAWVFNELFLNIRHNVIALSLRKRDYIMSIDKVFLNNYLLKGMFSMVSPLNRTEMPNGQLESTSSNTVGIKPVIPLFIKENTHSGISSTGIFISPSGMVEKWRRFSADNFGDQIRIRQASTRGFIKI